jgi:hypothetical protein
MSFNDSARATANRRRLADPGPSAARKLPRTWFHALPTVGTTVLLLWLGACGKAEERRAWSARDLVAEVTRLEADCRDLKAPDERSCLESFARKAVGRTIDVTGATVVSSYERGHDWHTRPYFALTYDKSSYIYLDQLDPSFQDELASRKPWVSIAYSADGRQLMFELAVDPGDAGGLQPGCRVDFSCKLAAVIRGGRSVYCRALSIDRLECPEHR